MKREKHHILEVSPPKNLTKRQNINLDQRLFTGNVAFYLAIPWMLQAPDTKKGAKIELRFIRVVTCILIIITYLLCLSSLSSILFLLALLYCMCMIFILIMCFKSNDLNFLIHWSLLLLTERSLEWRHHCWIDLYEFRCCSHLEAPWFFSKMTGTIWTIWYM